MSKGNDTYYWERFRRGEVNALSNIYILYVDDLYSYGLRIYADTSLVKDAIQEIFIHFLEKQKKLPVSGNIKAYIFRTLRNKILEELRSRNRKTEIDTLIFNSGIASNLSSEQLLILNEEDNEKLKAVENALSQLSISQKEAIYLRYTNGYNYEQIAEIMDISIPSARTLIYRSLKQVRMLVFSSEKKTISIYFLLANI